MVSICPKPSNKQIVHSKATVTHLLVVTLLSLVRGKFMSQGVCCGETLIPMSPVFEEQKVKLCECNGKIYYFVILPLLRSIICHSRYKLCELKDMERSNIPPPKN